LEVDIGLPFLRAVVWERRSSLGAGPVDMHVFRHMFWMSHWALVEASKSLLPQRTATPCIESITENEDESSHLELLDLQVRY
jgi:hypothetical protein